MVNNNLVGGWPTSLKNDELKSVGMMMTFPINMESHKIPWFQTTNQLWYGGLMKIWTDGKCLGFSDWYPQGFRVRRQASEEQ